MTDKKRPSTKKMRDYENEKVEMADELGTNDPDDALVNIKIASQGEAKFNKRTITKENNLSNPTKKKGH